MAAGRLTTAVVWFHRWVGVALCLLFAAWFLSGAVMVYVPFPALDRGEAARRSEPIEFAAVAIDPRAALAQSGVARPVRLRLVSVRATPTWLVYGEDGELIAIDARDGRLAPAVSSADAGAIAARYARGVVESVDGPVLDDQWTVPNDYDALRPLYRVRLVDSDDTDVYVSARSGEVVQWTTRRARAWNYVGAVVHWIYPTALRRHWSAWDRTVWWLSLIGTALALAGAWLGVTRIAGRQGGARWRWSAYRGWLRWHHVLGLATGALVLTWVFSGWLSMDHRRLFSSPDPTPEQARMFSGSPLVALLHGVTADELGALAPATGVEFRAAAGRAWATADGGSGPRSFAVHDASLVSVAGIPQSLIADAAARAWSARVLRVARVVPDDVYARLREGSLPDTTVRVELDDDHGTWVHVDAATGAIVGVMDRSRRVYRWLFNGLHGFDVPPLSDRRALWDASLLLGLAGGLGFVITSVVVAWRRVRTDLRARRPSGIARGFPATADALRSAAMKLPELPFTVVDWSAIPATEHPGETGTAHWRTQEHGGVRVRMVEYSPGYLADHWCDRGHILLVLEGELHTELRDGRTFRLTAGMSYQVSDFGDAAHRSSTRTGAKLFIVD